MEFRNGRLLQLFECIESTQNEVKRKMNDRAHATVYQSHLRDPLAKKNSGRIAIHSRLFSPRVAIAMRNF